MVAKPAGRVEDFKMASSSVQGIPWLVTVKALLQTDLGLRDYAIRPYLDHYTTSEPTIDVLEFLLLNIAALYAPAVSGQHPMIPRQVPQYLTMYYATMAENYYEMALATNGPQRNVVVTAMEKLQRAFSELALGW